VAVADAGSFTAAARALYMSQSTLSRQVAALERQLGAQLFDRGLRSVTLTPHGQAFLPHARRLLEEVAKAERVVGGGRHARHAP
jgi:DNA-binding transcriptional LysR family regulator